jgi:hypothetical protein
MVFRTFKNVPKQPNLPYGLDCFASLVMTVGKHGSADVPSEFIVVIPEPWCFSRSGFAAVEDRGRPRPPLQARKCRGAGFTPFHGAKRR